MMTARPKIHVMHSDDCRGYGHHQHAQACQESKRGVCMQSDRQLCSELRGHTQRKACSVSWGSCCVQERGRSIRDSILTTLSACEVMNGLPFTAVHCSLHNLLTKDRVRVLCRACPWTPHVQSSPGQGTRLSRCMSTRHTTLHVMPTDQTQTSANHSAVGQSLFCLYVGRATSSHCIPVAWSEIQALSSSGRLLKQSQSPLWHQ